MTRRFRTNLRRSVQIFHLHRVLASAEFIVPTNKIHFHQGLTTVQRDVNMVGGMIKPWNKSRCTTSRHRDGMELSKGL